MSDETTWSYANPAAHMNAALDNKVVMKIDRQGSRGIWLSYYSGGKESLLFLPAGEATEMANLILASLRVM